jgi:hypothetical protein
MNSSPSGGEDLHMVQREEPLPRLSESETPTESSPAPPSVSDAGDEVPARGRFTFIASLLLIAFAFSLGLSYFFEKRWLNPSTPTRAGGSAETALVEPGVNTSAGAPVALGPDAFHVSAISLGAQPRAVVNGKAVSEGDSFVVVTTSGPVTARVTQIEGGIVHFLAGDEKIDVKLNPAFAQEAAP